ncbi:MAG: MoxR family ATPase [Bacteroidia bacterium]|nr:MoxR family ATPase [Bacteroidia bacterium]
MPSEVPSFEPNQTLRGFEESVQQVKAEIGKVIVGQQAMIELMIAAMLTQGHILIEGVPGVAKTLAAKLLARCVAAGFSRIQFTPDLMPSDVLGTTVFNTQKGDFDFRAGPIFSQLILIDEINRAPAKTQSALFEVMEERQVTMDGMRYPMAEPFMVMATQNPIEQEGTYRLPEAQLDRFLFKIEVNYPSAEEELDMLGRFHGSSLDQRLAKVESVLSQSSIIELQEVVRQLNVEPSLQRYVVDIVQRTRGHRDIYLGASPRATLNLLQAGKAIAAMRGRDFLTPEDVQFVAVPVLRHRIMLTPEKELEGGTATEVIRQLVQEVEVPR